MAEEKAVTKKAVKEVVPVDPWKKKVTIRLPKAAQGEENYIIASVNGRVYKLMKGKEIDVPAPIAEVLQHSFEMQDEADEFIASLVDR